MLRTCERAVAIGLPAVVFTEHLDFEGWWIEPQDATDAIQHLISPKGILEVTSRASLHRPSLRSGTATPCA
jgi:hypothetical protein